MQPPELIWIDLEMTGLDVNSDVILEIAAIITNNDLEIIAEHPSIVIHHEDSTLASMDEWCKLQHQKSGLTQAVQSSTITTEQAATMILSFIKEHIPYKKGILCGNSVWQDKLFLQKYMPAITDYLFYRIIDVSSIKELLQRTYAPEGKRLYTKQETHRAFDDIHESIAELKYYKDNFFINSNTKKAI